MSVPASSYTAEQLDILEEIQVGFILDDMLNEATDEIGADDGQDEAF